jgi:hypothetical protein
MGIRDTAARTVGRVLGDSGLDHLRSVDRRVRHAAIRALDVETRTRERGRHERRTDTRSPEEQRQALIESLGNRDLDASVHQEGLEWASSDPVASFPPPPRGRHQLLEGLHAHLRPRTYLEIGIRDGKSLALSRARTIGVDPDYAISFVLDCDLRTFKLTSDDFFAEPDAFAHFGDVGVDLAFIDGMHLSDFVLRDFINTERHADPGGVVVLDDVLPRNHLEAYRIRRTPRWTGDIFKVFDVLRTYRPDLVVLPVNTRPTGTMVIAGLDPSNTTLLDSYDRIEPGLLSPDPQHVPSEVLHRELSVDPTALLSSDVWARAAALREQGGGVTEFQALYRELADLPRYGRTTAV